MGGAVGLLFNSRDLSMIKISHKQAERSISRQFDQLLSEEEWNALQSHLEQCPNCQRYQSQLERTERRLRQALKARWDPVSGPSRYLSKQVLKLHAEREDRRVFLSTSTFGGAVFILILLLAFMRGQISETATVIPQAAETGIISISTVPSTQRPTAIPLIQPGQFPHVIAYEASLEGNAEIYLLNPGFAPVNLTQHPAEDTFPTWSPDGEWLAFLSNRATLNQENSKNELYIISIAGNQLVQMTSESLVDWEGPLSWSADGKWIAATGVLRDSSQRRYIAIVGVDGSGLSMLLNKPGGTQPKFAPFGDRLAFYQREDDLDRLVIYHVNSGRAVFEDIPRSTSNPNEMDVSFDWPADGDGLYYTPALPPTHDFSPTLEPNCPRLIIQQKQNDEPWYEKLRDHFHLAKRGIAGAIHGISWAPDEFVIYIADTPDQDGEISDLGSSENFISFLNHPMSSSKNANVLMDLCVYSGLDRGAWSLDMRWFVFNAYEPDGSDAGLYAARIPGLELSWQPSGTTGIKSAQIPIGFIVRLSKARVKSSFPRIRPFRTWMKIQPQHGQIETIHSDTLLTVDNLK
jgi:hypothetical protein